MQMQKTVLKIQGVDVPVWVRHEEKGLMECETLQPVEFDGITVYPGCKLRAPVSSISRNQKSWVRVHNETEKKS